MTTLRTIDIATINTEKVFNMYSVKLMDGDEGIITQIIPKMIELVLRDSKDKEIIDIAKSCKKNTDIETVRSILSFVSKNFTHQQESPDEQMIVAPIHLITKNFHRGSVSINTLTAAMLLSLGFAVNIKILAWREPLEDGISPFTHIHLECYIPSFGKHVAIDPVNYSEIPFVNPFKIIRQQSFIIE